MEQKITQLHTHQPEQSDEEIEKQSISQFPNYVLEQIEAKEGNVQKKELSITEFVNEQCNKVVVFLINWIKTEYTKMIMNYLNNEYKQELIKELKK